MLCHPVICTVVFLVHPDLRRKRLFRENQATDCQEMEELRRICCEETDRAGQASVDELSLHQERNPTAVSLSHDPLLSSG